MSLIMSRIHSLSTARFIITKGKMPCKYYHSFDVKDAGKYSKTLKKCLGIAATAIATCGSLVYLLDKSVRASDIEVHPPNYPWAFQDFFTTLDHAALRRGWLVYKTVCATCHGLKYLAFHDMIDVFMSESEAKSTAAEYEIEDGPDDEGNYFKRAGKLYDKVPSPFANEEAARAANNGAYPEDLSLMVNARKNGLNYVFSLLTSYMDAPAGVALSDTQFFNPYFPGGAISMPQMLQEGAVEYEDGTPATKSQMAKDLVEFLNWVANREWDTRKLYLIEGLGFFLLFLPSYWIVFRQRWGGTKKMQIFYHPKQKCQEMDKP